MNEKYLMKLEDYISYLDESLSGEEWINNYGMVTDHSRDLIAVVIGNNTVRLMPGPEFAPFLYRGQNNKDCEKCLPSVYRPSFFSDRGHPDLLKFAVNWVKAWEFWFIVDQHPAIEDLQNAFIAGYKVEIDQTALSQHYGFSTHYLDFTRDEYIAKFFAYSKHNTEDDSWSPILNFAHYEPRLYKVSIKSLYYTTGTNLEVIGFQGLKRPDKQMAFCLANAQKYDLNELPCVTIQPLPPDPKEAKQIFEKFEGGKDLFPDEIIGTRAFAIKKDKLLTTEVVDFYCEENHLRQQEVTKLKDLLEKGGYSIGKKSLFLSPDERKQLLDTWTTEKESLQKRIAIRYFSDSA